ncbi:MAG TPA: DUF4446 family protein [Candidatus Levybacteria bacterium]|nr:DUF4446 family protein [Candidatus Levybacteria bacterium]
MILRPELVAIIVLTLWLLIVTVFFLRFYLYFSRISKKGEKQSLVALIDEVLRAEKENKKDIDRIVTEYATLKKDVSFHIQKVGLLRFNPFKDTGGDQSFILALVDAHNTGVIVSSYHTRSGTRWYAKGVKNGKSTEHTLSAEEEKALQAARTI